MKNARVMIRPAEIKAINFAAPIAAKSGELLKLKMSTGFGVGVNPEVPTNCVAKVKFIAETQDGQKVLEIATDSVVTASTYIDNFEDVIKREYSQIILLDVHEKIKPIAQALGMTLKFPGINLPYGNQDGDGSDDDTLDDILKNYGKI